jgi:hypothetical protein
MADKAHPAQDHSPDARGTMDLTPHMKTWLGFWAGVKWSVIAIVVLMILLAIFRTN